MTDSLTYIRTRTQAAPRIAVVLGSGLGGFADELADSVSIPYADIPGWTQSTAIGHVGKLVIGSLDGLEIAVLSGRSHFYEGYTPAQVTNGVRVLAQLGVKSIVFTNAAGGINLAYQQGGLVLISDHINLQGMNPLDRAQRRFPGPALSRYVGSLFAPHIAPLRTRSQAS